jgi:predicted O-linked N-acetylglucosamine transferase (SPINDLY family)
LLVFARKPAPIQVTYLGYPNTTGLATMDYRLADAECDPPGMTEAQYTEKLIRLPRGIWCYRPADNTPEPRDIPETPPDSITFGTFNMLAKVTPDTMRLWARILNAVPNSSFLIKAESLRDPEMRQTMRSSFAEHGADPSCVDVLGREPSFVKHLATYHRLDIALDTFPYNGTTTTCEAMWMGVPTVTLAGHAHLSRVGASLMTRAGSPELVAQTPDDFVQIAVDLARDHMRRRDISGINLRQRMKGSPLMDEPGFARDLEAAYRGIWRKWCEAT